MEFEDETWWSRTAPPAPHAWAPAGQPVRLIEQTIPKDDSDPKVLAAYGACWRATAMTPRKSDGASRSAVREAP